MINVLTSKYPFQISLSSTVFQFKKARNLYKNVRKHLETFSKNELCDKFPNLYREIFI